MFELTPYDRRTRRQSAVIDPFRELENMERFFFGRPEANGIFKTDISDEGDAYILEAELPGFNKDEIHVDLDGDYMTISAEHSTSSEKKDKKGDYIRQERSYGSYSRSFDISGIDAAQTAAEYKDGILTLRLPKKAAETHTATRVEIK